VLPSRIWVLEWRWDRIRERFAAEAEPLWILEEGLRERAPGLFEEFLRGLKASPPRDGGSRRFRMRTAGEPGLRATAVRIPAGAAGAGAVAAPSPVWWQELGAPGLL